MSLPSDHASFPYQMDCALCDGPGELIQAASPFKSQGMCVKCGARASPSTQSPTDAALRWNYDQNLINDWKRDAKLLTSVREELAASQAKLAQACLELQSRDQRLRGRPLRATEPEVSNGLPKPRG